jgi:hypothetical protein
MKAHLAGTDLQHRLDLGIREPERLQYADVTTAIGLCDC